MFNFSKLTHESHDTAQELIDWFDVEGLSLGYHNGEWIVTDSQTEAIYFTAEYAWEVRDYINEIDEDCFCDGSDDAPYTCTFPPCVAERNSYRVEVQPYPTDEAYDRTDPKHYEYAENIIAAIDEGRIR